MRRDVDLFSSQYQKSKKRISGWARVYQGESFIWQPTTVEELPQFFEIARTHGKKIAFRGSGHSYTDASLNTNEITVNLTRMKRILAWNPATGVIVVEPGVTIRDLWQVSIKDGWWPPVVPTTMDATVGGCVSMNVFGKNAFHQGSFGEYILSLMLVLPSGDAVTISKEYQSDIFHAVIGGLGLLGCIVRITLQLLPVRSGYLEIHHHVAASLQDMLRVFENEKSADYLGGWIDCFATGAQLGRGIMQIAYYSDRCNHSSSQQQLQRISTFSNLVISSLGALPMRYLLQHRTQAINDILYQRGITGRRDRETQISLAQFCFDPPAVYNAIRMVSPHGICSFQAFVPYENALETFTALLEISQKYKVVPLWSSLKLNRRNSFLLNCQVDGYSLELVYVCSAINKHTLPFLLKKLLHIVMEAHGYVYLAKDHILYFEAYRAMMGERCLDQFLTLKKFLDPDTLFQSDLFRRLLIST